MPTIFPNNNNNNNDDGGGGGGDIYCIIEKSFRVSFKVSTVCRINITT